MIYAYGLTSKTHVPSKDINTRTHGNGNPVGLWSHGGTLYVADAAKDKIFAYRLSDGARDASKDVAVLRNEDKSKDNRDPIGILYHGENWYVANSVKHSIYEYIPYTSPPPPPPMPKPVNTPPTANAGTDLTVFVNSHVTLTGTATDPDDMDTLTYAWTQSGSPTVALSDAVASNPTFTAPSTPATITFTLTVSDDTATHTVAGFVFANAAMYAMLFLVACDVCGFTMDAGVLAALVAGTFAFSTPYYVRIALGKRGDQDADTSEPDTGDS